jgi:hypothetical protein
MPPAQLRPERLAHLIGGVLREFRDDVCVALGLAELGVAEDLLHDAGCRCPAPAGESLPCGGRREPAFPDSPRASERERKTVQLNYWEGGDFREAM